MSLRGPLRLSQRLLLNFSFKSCIVHLLDALCALFDAVNDAILEAITEAITEAVPEIVLEVVPEVVIEAVLELLIEVVVEFFVQITHCSQPLSEKPIPQLIERFVVLNFVLFPRPVHVELTVETC